MPQTIEKTIKRQHVLDNDGTVNVTFGPEGISYKPAGKVSAVSISHDDLVAYLVSKAEKGTQKIFKDNGVV